VVNHPRTAPVTRGAGAVVRYFRGVGLLGRGMTLAARRPRLLILGMIPVVIAAAIVVAGFVTLIYFIEDVAAAGTWFADDWPEDSRQLVRILAGIAILGAGLLFAVVTFVQLTLLIGDPFYEKISTEVEAWYGGVTDEVEFGLWRSVWRNLANSIRMLAIAAAVGICLFPLGFIPVVGQTVVPVLGATVGGWLLAVELTGVAYARRGHNLGARWRALRRHRPEALGFGTAVFVCFTFIPFGAVLFMPAAVAGGTLLARKTLGLPYGESR
jgi:CysZ protein